jgi:hypothetical protein
LKECGTRAGAVAGAGADRIAVRSATLLREQIGAGVRSVARLAGATIQVVAAVKRNRPPLVGGFVCRKAMPHGRRVL